jgi:hypothetical protein
MNPRPRSARKLLVASIGVAAVTYACGGGGGSGPGTHEPVGNLVAPEPTPAADSGATAPDAAGPPEEPVGNLVAPPPDGPGPKK